jgi:hypothetical protein
MSQMNPLQQLIQSLTKAPPAAGPGIQQGNAPSPQDLISKLMAFIHPQQPSPQASPIPPVGGQPGPHQIPPQIMQILRAFIGGQIPNAKTGGEISPNPPGV